MDFVQMIRSVIDQYQHVSEYGKKFISATRGMANSEVYDFLKENQKDENLMRSIFDAIDAHLQSIFGVFFKNFYVFMSSYLWGLSENLEMNTEIKDNVLSIFKFCLTSYSKKQLLYNPYVSEWLKNVPEQLSLTDQNVILVFRYLFSAVAFYSYMS